MFGTLRDHPVATARGTVPVAQAVAAGSSQIQYRDPCGRVLPRVQYRER
jgi:hypothetical protein